MSAWVEIDLRQIESNFLAARRYLAEGAQLCPVLKADAYGHGIDRVLPALLPHELPMVAIASNEDAARVRAAGFGGRIIRVRAATRSEMAGALPLRVEELIGTWDAAVTLARLSGGGARAHLALNSGGMGRDGLELSRPGGREEGRKILSLPGLEIVGLLTHYPDNSQADLARARQIFNTDVAWVFANSNLQRDRVLIHAGSSLTLIAGCEAQGDMVRGGAVLYGVVGPRDQFGSAMSLMSEITSIQTFPAGATVGYDRAHLLDQEARIANVAIGYANGYSRRFGGKMDAIVRGARVPVVGKISMNSLSLDITKLPAAKAGDHVTLFGHGQISEAEVERAAGTLVTDLYLDWGSRNPRIYVG